MFGALTYACVRWFYYTGVCKITASGTRNLCGHKRKMDAKETSEKIPLPSHTPIQSDLEHQEPDGMTVRCVLGQTIACQVLCRKFDSDLE